jgi:hypothetical protein
MEFADDAEDPVGAGPDVVDGGEDLAEAAEDFPGDTDDAGPDEVEADEFHAEASGAEDFHARELDAAEDPADEPAEPRPSTGDPRVDAALARLDELEGRPVTEHRAVFEDVHRRLRDVLGELDSRQQPQSRDVTDAAARPGR